MEQPYQHRCGVRYLGRLVNRYFGERSLALSHYHSGYAVDAPLLTMVEIGSENFVMRVLQWEERYKTQSTLWSREDFRPAPPAEAELDAPAYLIASDEGLDDFGGNIEVRRLQARLALDDFSNNAGCQIVGWVGSETEAPCDPLVVDAGIVVECGGG